MNFGKKRNWEEEYDEDYVARTDRREKLRGSTMWIHIFGFAVGAGILLGLVGLVGGQAMFEKTLTALASPVGAVWAILTVLVYFTLLYRQGSTAVLVIASWLILSVCGNLYVANQLMLMLERPYLDTSIDDLKKLDVVFLLGGGTTTNLQGTAQTDLSGDRLVTAARLYHAGKVDLIVCTGFQQFRTAEADMHPHQEAASLLADLNVPDSSIAMAKGRNTKEELQIAAKFLEQQQLSDARVGIITSAWHLNRAGRLAVNSGLEPVLIPSDFRSRHFTTGPNLLIPSGASLADSGRCFKEFLAGMFGR